MNDVFFLEQAYKQAQKAFDHNEVPVGALLVDENEKIVARSYNQIESKLSQTAHAELLVIKKAARKIQNWRLQNMTLYVSVQPCLMCLGAVYLSRVVRVVYGVESTKFGISIDCFKNQATIYKNLKMEMKYLPHEASIHLLQLFFKKKRRKVSHEQNRITKNNRRSFT